MKNLIYPVLFLSLCLLVPSCSCDPKDERVEQKKPARINDSLSKLLQKARVDSMKLLNPLLIMPPDSEYSGQYIDRYKNGIVKFRGTYRFGQQHGQWFSFYPNGLMWSEMHFDNGLRHGPNNTFYENGIARYSGFYKNDLVDSVWTYYDSTGKIVEILNYRNNLIVSRKKL